MHRFRIFISYANEDRHLAVKLDDALRGLGIDSLWDKDILPGTQFTDAIKGLISYAHLFMPLITGNSQKRPWVHQETGYAMALNIPVLPVAVNTLPAEMISQLQAISINEDGSDLVEKLSGVSFEKVVFPPPQKPPTTVEIADWPEVRTELMARYANLVMELGAHGRVRQRGALSSFSIPNKHIDHPDWKAREGVHPRSRYYITLLREERRALEKHARERGCSLIIDPTIDFSKLGPTVTRARVGTLLDFLKEMANERDKEKVQVVITPQAREGHLTILGDWFVAESLTPRRGEGYKQTIFSWHAPTVLRWVRKFDQELEELQRHVGWPAGASLGRAVEEIEKILAALPDGEGGDGEPPGAVCA
jgi:hypothetical protein